MVKKGLSFEEKQQVLLQALLQKNQFFNYKEIEKIACQAGIVLQAVKDVLQSLVDENLVNCDKIGKQNIYWVLSVDVLLNARRMSDAEMKRKEQLEKKRDILKKQLEFFSSSEYGDKPTRDDLIEKIENLQVQKQKLLQDIQCKKSYGVESLKALKTLLAQSCEMSTRWGDNIYVVRAWIKQRFPQIAEADINTHFDIPSDLF